MTIGIDLGGTKILTALIDSRGKIVLSDQRATLASEGPDIIIEAMLDSIRNALKQADASPAEIGTIGIAAAGLADSRTGVLYTSPNLPGWHHVPLRDRIQQSLGIKTFLINDAKAAALGEYRFGAGRGTDYLIYVTLGTGIGGGIVINGKIYGGATGLAGEIGHMTIDDNGPKCYCGNTGCWEVLASGTAMAREAKRLITSGADTSILDLTGGDIEKVTAEIINTAALNGDRPATELIAWTSHNIGVGLANLINIFNPRLIVIGGGLSKMGDMLLKPAYEVAGQRAFKEAYDAVRFAPAGLGGSSGVLGAAAFARDQLKKGR